MYRNSRAISDPNDTEVGTAQAPQMGLSSIPLTSLVIIFLGGAGGTVIRYLLGLVVPDAQWPVPVTTFLINVVGAFILGLLLEALVLCGSDTGWRRNIRLGVGTGFCGGFTTYSSFAVATEQMLRHGDGAKAAVYGVGSVVVGSVAAFIGIVIAARLRKISRVAR